MLKLTVKAGEYLLIGDDIKVVYTGGSGGNAHILIDAPKSMNIARSGALEKSGMAAELGIEGKYYKDRELSPAAKEKIRTILMEERRNVRNATLAEERRNVRNATLAEGRRDVRNATLAEGRRDVRNAAPIEGRRNARNINSME